MNGKQQDTEQTPPMISKSALYRAPTPAAYQPQQYKPAPRPQYQPRRQYKQQQARRGLRQPWVSHNHPRPRGWTGKWFTHHGSTTLDTE